MKDCNRNSEVPCAVFDESAKGSLIRARLQISHSTSREHCSQLENVGGYTFSCLVRTFFREKLQIQGLYHKRRAAISSKKAITRTQSKFKISELRVLGKLGLIMNVHNSTFEMCLRNFHQIALLRHLPQSSQYDPSCSLSGNIQRQLEGALMRPGA